MSNSNEQNSLAAPQTPPPGQQPPIVDPIPLPPVPSTAPSSSNNIRAVTPGWRFQPGNPGTMADTAKVVDNRVIDASKIYRGGRSMELPPLQPNGSALSFASNTVQAPASIVELARALKNDPQLIFEYVYNNIDWQPGWGVMKGALGTLLDGSGNSFDQSMLLVALLRQAGFTASYVLGQIRLTTVQYDAWFGTDSTFPNYYCCYWYAQYANIPCSAPVSSGSDFIMDMSHVWVKVTVSGTTYMLDPSRKTYTRKSPVSGLATILGYNASTFLSNAQSGATVDPSGNFVQNMNTANIRNDLTTMTSNLVSYINGNAIGSAPAGTATVDDILGGREITPITLPFTWSTTLPYEMPGDVPTIWTGDVPLTHKTTLQVQYPLSTGGWAIDQTFTSDQLAGTRLTLTFDSTLHPVLSLNGTVLATGSEAQGVGSFTSILLTVNHNAFASPVYPVQWWQGAIYANTGNLYLIANAWGSAGDGQLNFHKEQFKAARAAVLSNTEPVTGELMSQIWFNMIAQASRVADLVGRMNSTNMNFFHQVGIVSNIYNSVSGTANSATDIGGVSGFSSTLNFDFSQLARTNTVVATHGVALEAAALAQITGLSPGASTTTVVDKANRTAAVTIGGTVTVGNTLTITVNDAALSGGTKSKTYTVVSGDTLTSIATSLAALINADTDLAAIGVTATSNGAVILVSSDSVNQTSYSSSTSVGATETISIVFLKIFLGTQSNWNSGANVSATLVANGYNSSDMSAIYSNYLSGGYNTVVLPDRPGLKVNNSFTGWGDWIFPKYTSNGGAFGLINNVSKGGQGITCGVVITPEGALIPVCAYTGFDLEGRWIDPSRQDISGDPIAMFSGDFVDQNCDITVGSQSFPYGLTFERFYNSKHQYRAGTLGRGWRHSHEISAVVGSDGMVALGDQNAVHGAASIVQLFLSMDIATDSTQPLVKLVTMTLANKWWVEQLVNNTVGIVSPLGGVSIFVKQPTGSFTAPVEMPGVLTKVSGNYRFTSLDGSQTNFNSDGQISTVVLPAGVTVAYLYSSGRLSSISNSLGRTLTLNYTGGKLSSVTDGNGRTVTYTLDSSNNLTAFADSLSNVMTYEYDQPGRLVKKFMPLNPSNPMIVNTYDSLSRVKTQANARGQIWTYYFAGYRSEEVDSLSNSTVSYFNRFAKTIRRLDALGYQSSAVYDGLQRLIEVTMPEGNKVRYVYDANSKVLTQTFVPKPGSGLSNIQFSYTYDSTWGKLKTLVDGKGETCTWSYDAVTGNLLSVTKPTVTAGTPQRIFTYNSRGQIETVVDETSIVGKFIYDSTTEILKSIVVDYSAGAGRLNLSASFGHDAVGNVTSVTDARGNQSTFQFDSERRLTQLTGPSPLGYLTNVVYNANGYVSSVHNQVTNAPTFRTTSFGYSLSDKLQSVVDPTGKVTIYTYDGADRLWSITDPQGRVCQYAYDALNRQTTFTDPNSSVSATVTYTINGLKKSVKDGNNNVTQYTYDGFDRRTVTTFADSTTEQITSFDGNSNPLTFSTRSGNTVTLTYDALNRLSTKAPQGQATVTYLYDLAGRILSVSKPIVAGDPSTGLFQFAYDTAGRFVQEQYPDGKTVSHELDANGNRTKTTWPDGFFVTRSFDQMNRLTNIFVNGSGTPSLTYSFDQLSRRSSVVMGNGTSTSYTFSLNDDLVAQTNNFVGSFNLYSRSFNNSRQLIGVGVNDSSFIWHPIVAGTLAYGSADSVNKYPSVGAASFSYDGNKNLSSDGIWTFSYDTENQLLSAVASGTTASYVYDPRNRQARKTVNGTQTQFIYDGLDLIATYDGSGNLVSRFVRGSGVDEVAIQVSAAGSLSFLHSDSSNSIVAITDNSGAVTDKYVYSPFGESVPLVGTTFGYTGQRYDAETRAYYYKARQYSPEIGRFLQPDPIGYDGGDMNLYVYVSNDPLNFVDPMGLSKSNGQFESPYKPFKLGASKSGYEGVQPPTQPLDPGRFPKLVPQTQPTAGSSPNLPSGPVTSNAQGTTLDSVISGTRALIAAEAAVAAAAIVAAVDKVKYLLAAGEAVAAIAAMGIVAAVQLELQHLVDNAKKAVLSQAASANLTANQVGTALHKAIELELKALEPHSTDTGGIIKVEQQWYLGQPGGGAGSSRADLLILNPVTGKPMLVIDWKSGFSGMSFQQQQNFVKNFGIGVGQVITINTSL